MVIIGKDNQQKVTKVKLRTSRGLHGWSDGGRKSSLKRKIVEAKKNT